MKRLVRRSLKFFVDSWLVAGGAVLWPAACAVLRASGLPPQATGGLLFIGLAAVLMLSVRNAITGP